MKNDCWHIEITDVTKGPWSYGSWIYTEVESSNPVYSIKHYVIKFISDLWQVSAFLHQ